LREGKPGSLRLLMIVQITQSFRGGIISPIMALFIRRQGLSITQIGLLGTAGMLGWFIFEPLSGIIADRVRKKYMIIFAVVTSTVIYASYPYASSIWHFAVLAFVSSSVMSTYAVSVKALTAEFLPTSQRGRAYGRYLSIISAGGILAPFIGGFVTSSFGYDLPFFISAGIGVISLGAVLVMRSDEEVDGGEAEEGEAGDASLMTRPILSIFTVRGLYMFNLLFRQHFLPIYLNESPNFNASEAEIGAYMGVLRIASAVSQAFLGELNDRLGSKRIIVSSVILLALSYLGMTYFSGIVALYVLGGLQGVVIAAANMSMMIHLMDIMPEERTGMVMGLYSEAENVGGMIASPSLGYIYDGIGPAFTLQSVSAVLISTAAIALLLIGKDDRYEKSSKT